MKRFAVIFLSLFLCLFCLVGCGDRTDRYGFYAQSTLNRNLIPNLPKVRSDGKTSLNEGVFTFTTTQEEFDEYLNSVYDYLVSCSFEYFGYPTEVLGTFFGGAPECAFAYGSELSDFKMDESFFQSLGQSAASMDYFFVWGNNGINESTGSAGYPQIVNARYLQIGCYAHEGYVNAYMRLKYALMDYTFYLPVDDTEYKLTVNDPSGYIIEPLKESYRAGEKVTVKTQVLFDVDLIAYLDGVSLGSQTSVKENDEYHWEFYFDMPDHDAVLSFELSGGM